MYYRLDGAMQSGYQRWKWFKGEGEFIVGHGESVKLVDYKNYFIHKPFPELRKWIMKAMGYNPYYSNRTKTHIIIHNSIIERYFTRLNL